MSETPLESRLKAQIAQEGPINVARLMTLALGDPVHGYYMTRDPFGTGGDFTTAPEISQMFGELIGLWAVHGWKRLGKPTPLHLVELGPGRGTLMADAMRAIQKVAPDFAERLRIDLVETSPLLKAKQAKTLSGYRPVWHSAVSSLPDAPLIVIANEFFDALPIRQFERRNGAWHERLVGLENDRLIFGVAKESTWLEEFLDAPEGSVAEFGEEGLHLLRDLANHIARKGGATLLIDYGHTKSGLGDTLQALRARAFVHPLAFLGQADLTAHVDFEKLAKVALQAGVSVDSLTTQANFLEALGIQILAERLKRKVTSAQAAAIDNALSRLTDRSPTGMGRMFKTLTLSAIAPSLKTQNGLD